MMTAVVEQKTAISVWEIDSSHSWVDFSVKHMVFATAKGSFQQVSGTIALDESDFSHSTVAVSIPVDTLTTNDENRDAHLKSPDFFDAEQFPQITFNSTSVSPLAAQDFTVTGDLTIHGITQRVTLDAEMTGRWMSVMGKEVIGFTAATRISRKDYNLVWNVALEAGGLMVGDEIKITLEIQAIQQ